MTARSAEEQELWPLFAEHFSIQEQEALVRRAAGCAVCPT